MEKPTLLVLLGAGSTADVGCPKPITGLCSTRELTEAISRLHGPLAVLPGTPMLFGTGSQDERPFRLDHPVSVCKVIARALRGDYQEVDFELILHALDELQLLADVPRYSDALDAFRPVLATFVEMQSLYAFLCDPSLLRQARHRVIGEIYRLINNSTFRCGGPHRAAERLSHFLKMLATEFRLAVFTLNYDEVVDNALPDWFDGFQTATPRLSARPFQIFDAREFLRKAKSSEHLLVHLHGSVRFGISLKHRGPVKFESSDDALKSITYTSGGDSTIGGRLISSSPLVSGLDKAAKLIYRSSPFGYYYKAFVDALLESPLLLIIGGRDEHVNTWLNEFRDHHSGNRRIVCVGKFSGPDVWKHTPEQKYASLLAGGPNNWKEWFAGPDAPHFQEHGPNLRLVPSGFPFKESDCPDKIMRFLMS